MHTPPVRVECENLFGECLRELTMYVLAFLHMVDGGLSTTGHTI